VGQWPTTDKRGEPTPGERLLYALGQLYRQWYIRATLTPPGKVDVEAVAKMLGVWGEVEFVQDGEDEDSGQQHLAAGIRAGGRTGKGTRRSGAAGGSCAVLSRVWV
jgi:hypothetical protein